MRRWRYWQGRIAMLLPPNLRALNIARHLDGRYQASLQTDEHAPNGFSVAFGATVEEAVTEVCRPYTRKVTALPY